METLYLLFLLQLKHWYADFASQTYDQTVKKGLYGDIVGISHSIDHFVWSLIALLIFSISFTVIPAFIIFMVALIESTVHYHIDWFKVKFGTKNITSPLFWNQFGLDQLAHQLTYLAMVIYLLQ